MMTGTGSKLLPLHAVYIVELREHALALLWLGYARLKAPDFATAEEDEITGELVKEMNSALEDDRAPSWVEHYSVSEQVRSNTKGRRGKRRPIVDVELERHKRGPRPRLRFEAKRLCASSGVSDYVGAEGLGAFLDGYYTRTHNEAGMLGYVQSQTEGHWADKLGKSLIAPSYGITPDGNWLHMRIVASSPHTYQTIHTDHEGVRLFVFHSLLNFCAT
jgi:hypothetical protein